jgi:hypothetical protein
MHCIPCPFTAPFLCCALLLLRSHFFFTCLFHITTIPFSSFFCIFIISVLLVHPLCSFLLHALLTTNVHHIGVFTATFAIPLPHSCAPHYVSVLHLLLLLSALPGHHGNSSTSLGVSHASIITGCYTEISHLLWQLRLFVFSIIDELILWKKPSIVSNSYTLECNSSPPILFKFIYTICNTPTIIIFKNFGVNPPQWGISRNPH